VAFSRRDGEEMVRIFALVVTLALTLWLIVPMLERVYAPILESLVGEVP
jgi:hypothetical protein